jgi:hypothetical protein
LTLNIHLEQQRQIKRVRNPPAQDYTDESDRNRNKAAPHEKPTKTWVIPPVIAAIKTNNKMPSKVIFSSK